MRGEHVTVSQPMGLTLLHLRQQRILTRKLTRRRNATPFCSPVAIITLGNLSWSQSFLALRWICLKRPTTFHKRPPYWPAITGRKVNSQWRVRAASCRPYSLVKMSKMFLCKTEIGDLINRCGFFSSFRLISRQFIFMLSKTDNIS